ncbi:carbohydrate ABC transporter permease [Georgenia alba]|uniref:Carbohydrate ABC transporter permease n=1 Tax=Georgenia alba TaxID=2233858 RepID=A0ABW2QDN6_9MICO
MLRRLTARELPLFAVLLVPGLAVVALVIVVPLVLVLQYSTYQASSFSGGGTFVGLENYATLLGSPDFWQSLWRTLVYAGGSVLAQLVVGIAVALVLNVKFRGSTFLRGAAIVPYIVPAVVATIAWEWILDPSTGIFNKLLEALGLQAVNFLSAPWAMTTVIMLSTWAWAPFVIIVFLSGLQTIPQELYESARVDGAGHVRQFFSITLPMLRDLVITIVVLRGIWMFNKFDMIYLLTAGGPLDRTRTLPVLVYDEAFQQFHVGYGSAVAVVSLLVMLTGLLLFLWLSRDRSENREVAR